nr:MAG TPA: hypothetical protein [Caudoviricetes sp.]
MSNLPKLFEYLYSYRSKFIRLTLQKRGKLEILAVLCYTIYSKIGKGGFYYV